MELKAQSVTDVSPQGMLDLGNSKKSRKPYMKQATKRVLHAIGNGLRTATSIANALNEPKAKIVSRLWHLKDQGLIHGEKKQGSAEFKYYLVTDAPKLGQLDLTPKKRKYTKRMAKVANVAKVVSAEKETVLTAENAKTIVQMQMDIDRFMQRISNLEVALSEKEKEVWTLECEIFDKKAIITYLEGKLALKGVI